MIEPNMEAVQLLSERLKTKCPERDVAVFVGRTFYGLFVWDEVGGRHTNVSTSFLRWAVGEPLYLDRVVL